MLLTEAHKPAVVLAFANDRLNRHRYLYSLRAEREALGRLFREAGNAECYETIELGAATPKDVQAVFQTPRLHDRVAVFHFAGHADAERLWFESPDGCAVAVAPGHLADIFRHRRGPVLVFLNACATGRQVERLFDAGVDYAIATDRETLNGWLAVLFAHRFYRALLCGRDIGHAFDQASRAIMAVYGRLTTGATIREAIGATDSGLAAKIAACEAAQLRGVYRGPGAPHTPPWRLYRRRDLQAPGSWSLRPRV